MLPHTIEAPLAEECGELTAVMDSVQQGLGKHLALAGFEIAEPEISDFVPVIRLCFSQELLKLSASIIAHAKKFIYRLRR